MTDQLAGSWQMMPGFGVLNSEHPVDAMGIARLLDSSNLTI
jgi:hypothetical protein